MPAAFDTIAPDYDEAFTDRPLGRCLRESVWAHLDAAFRPGDRVLDLGCGTGEDALHLARRGVQVHAVDGSPKMLDAAILKAAGSGVNGLVSFAVFDLADPAATGFPQEDGAKWDGAYSNFGALNCVADRRVLARRLAERVRTGGRIVLVLMGPCCPWEWLWFGARLELRKAVRRLRKPAIARLAGGAELPVFYPSLRTLKRELGPWFRPVYSAGIGVVLPPTFAAGFLDRRPALLASLARWDRRLGRTPPARRLNDHYVAVFERTPAPAETAPAPSGRYHAAPETTTGQSAERPILWRFPAAARRLLRWRFRLFQRHRHNRTVTEAFGDFTLTVLPGVFNPVLFKSGALLAGAVSEMPIKAGHRVLDMGTGSGIGALAAARKSADVDAVDVNPAAVRCARLNAEANGLADRIEVLQGDLFGPVHGRLYDLVLFNPPYFRGEPGGGFDTAWRSPDVVERFAAGLHDVLRPGGEALVVLSTDGESRSFLEAFRKEGFALEVVRRRRLLAEVLTVYRLARRRETRW